MKDKRNRTPLNWALGMGTSADVVKMILDAYPLAAEMKDSENGTILHCILENGASADIVKMVLDAYPAAAEMKDNWNKTPLHCALEKGASADTVKIVFDAYPAAAEMKDKRNRTPLHCALTKNASADVLLSIFSCDFPLSSDGSHKNNHFFTWTDILDPANKVTLEKLKSFVILVFEANLKYASNLATVKDRTGREVVNIVHPDIKTIMQRYTLFLGTAYIKVNCTCF
jgi:hypothetical protein